MSAAEALEALSREHGLALLHLWAELFHGWARGRLHDPAAGAAELRQALAAFTDQGQMLAAPFFYGASRGARGAGAGRRTARSRTSTRRWLSPIKSTSATSLIHASPRGEILLKRDPATPAPVEEAFQTAIAVAKEQGARSFGLHASLALAKLYHSTGRAAEAHAMLAPALEGFSPTPEMPEIAEAQALLAALAETEEVNAAEAQRQRRLHLQTQYGQAMMWAKGFAAEETRAAFSRATDLAANTGNFAARFAAGHGQWVTAVTLGEQRRARELASAFLKEAEDAGRVVEAGVARRGLAVAATFPAISWRRGSIASGRSPPATPSAKRRRGTLHRRHGPCSNVRPRHDDVAIGRGRARARTDR